MDTLKPVKNKSERAPTIYSDGKRRWLYPDRRNGDKSKKRKKIAIFLIVVYVITPFLSLNDLPLVRMDISTGIVSFWGYAFRFHDGSFTFFIFVIFALLLFLVTSVRGRVWCGYACPQTVWIDWVVRPLEELLEGNAARRRITDSKPLSVKIFLRKSLKHCLYFLLAAALSHVLLAYFVAPVEIFSWVTESPLKRWEVFLAVFLLTGAIYFDFAWFREQFCAFLCPYARFQSVMMDDHTPVVAYDYNRGEPRGKKNSKGDCIDCQLCVRVCPTGIDIRKGLQLECIQCSRCVDACNMVMKNLKREPNLIGEFSSSAYQNKTTDTLLEKLKKPKNMFFFITLMFFVGFLIVRIQARNSIEILLTRQAGTTYAQLEQGKYANLFRLNVINTTSKPQSVSLISSSSAIDVICSGCSVPLQAFEEKEFSLVVTTVALATKQAELIVSPTGEKISLPFILPEKRQKQ
ncbi:MAG: cytochrome c oxidase accessory protein CcoG [Oligoflexales bacterium]